MNFTTKHHQLALTFIAGIGSRRARILLSHFSDLEEFFTEQKVNLAHLPGIPRDFIRHKHRMAALEEADRTLERCAKSKIETLFFTDENYPRRLRNCDDAPLLLYIKGTPDLNTTRSVAIVGTRHATDYGKKLTEQLTEKLSDTGATIVSGMAYGIDICAHKAALKNDLPTIGVLGHGADRIYPAVHSKVAGSMLDNGGLVTEFPPGLKPEPGFFPMRNRIVAGITDATIVVESGVKGGSLITAHLANDYNRDVFAFPGDVNRDFSAGCLRLIQENKAHLLISPGNFTDMMGWKKENPKTVQRSAFADLNPAETQIVAALKEKKELSQDSISHLFSMTPANTAACLLELEFKGILRSLPGKRYSLV